MSLIEEAKVNFQRANHSKVIELCRKILAKNINLDALLLLGNSLFEKSLYHDALDMMKLAERVNNKDVSIKLTRIKVQMKLAETVNNKYFAQCAVELRRILKSDPDNYLATSYLFQIYHKLFFQNSARRLLESYLERNPSNGAMQYEYFRLLTNYGEFEAAKEALDKGIKDKPLLAMDYTWKNVNPGYDPEARLAQLAKAKRQTKPTDFYQSNYYLSCGYAHERKKDYEAAFKAFVKANDKMRPTRIYNREAYVNFFRYFATALTRENLENIKKFSKEMPEPDIVPVFIVGLPRSGSTLIETILCAHDEISGVGEINDFKENILRHLGERTMEGNYTIALSKITKEQLADLRDDYIKLLSSKNARKNRDAKGRFVINKMLTNFHYIPLIKAMYPNAKIIHAKRHVLDCTWSMFKMFFEGDDNYLYNLKELGDHYNLYRELIDIYQDNVLDEGDMLEVVHEELTKDPDAQIERMLDYLGLDHDREKCLKFYEQDINVRTASFAQVRKPITHKETMAWEPYEQYLGDLIGMIDQKYLDEVGFVPKQDS